MFHNQFTINNINDSIHKNADSAKSMLAELKEKIINTCKTILQGLKDHSSSALDKTSSFLKLQKGLEVIVDIAVKNSDYCDNAIKRIEQFSENYHKTGLSLRNMGRIMIGKELIDATRKNGKLVAAVSASYKREKGIWAAIERKTFVATRDLGDFHTRTQINKKEMKQVITNETPKKTDIFAGVNTHKADISENKKKLTVDIKKEKTESR